MGLFDFFSNSSSSLSDAEILAKLKPIIADQLGVDEWEVVPQANIYDDLGCDELDLVELMIAIQERTRLSFPPTKDKSIRTVGDIIRYIKKYN